MIICPNSGDECTKQLIKPKSRTAFLIIAYPDENDGEVFDKIHNIEQTIIDSFDSNNYNVILARDVKGRNLYCKICQQIQSVPIGVIVYTEETPSVSFPNLFLELGIMSSFGKELILLKDYKVNIPNDLHGLEWTLFKDAEDLTGQLSEQIEQYEETSDYYYNDMGKFFREKGDLVKVIDYYKRAYLLYPREEILGELDELLEEIGRISQDDRYYALSIRLKDNLKYFLKCMRDEN